MENETTYQRGIPETLRHRAATLFDDAFGEKFTLAIRSRKQRIDLFTKGMNLEYAFAAISKDQLVGMAGFHDAQGSLTGGIDYKMLINQLGYIRGNRAAVVFSLYERKLAPAELLMDGISVRSDSRGKGIGTKLLRLVKEHASAQGLQSVRLDVVDANVSARRLYERSGFVETRTEQFGYLRWLLGYGGVSTMSFACSKLPAKSTST